MPKFVTTHAYGHMLGWVAANSHKESTIDGLRLQTRLKRTIEEKIGPPELAQSPYQRSHGVAAVVASIAGSIEKSSPDVARALMAAVADFAKAPSKAVVEKTPVTIRWEDDDLKALKERVESLVKMGAKGEGERGVGGGDSEALLDLWDAIKDAKDVPPEPAATPA